MTTIDDVQLMKCDYCGRVYAQVVYDTEDKCLVWQCLECGAIIEWIEEPEEK